MNNREEWIAQIREDARRLLADGCHTLRIPTHNDSLVQIEGDPVPSFGWVEASCFALVGDKQEAEMLYDLLVKIGVLRTVIS